MANVKVWEDGKIVEKPGDFVAPLTEQEIQIDLVNSARAAVQGLIDAVAQNRLYDNSTSFASYATPAEPNEQWRAEAYAFVAWRSAVWAKVYELQALAMAGSMPIPTVQDVLDALPPITWPITVTEGESE